MEPFKGLASLYLEMAEIGWRTRNPHNNLYGGYCEVDFLDHFSLDPNGNVYLCTHTFDKTEAIGSILPGKDFIQPSSLGKYVRWYTVNPFEDSTCTACNLLPLCLGGCRLSRFTGHRECIEEKDCYDLFIKNLIKEQLFAKNLI